MRGGHGLVAFVVLAGLLGARVALAQVSPGPLARAHRSVDGPVECFKCHPSGGGGKGTMDSRCLACHTEIAAMKQAKRGFHATIDKPCASCHPDHGGRDFKLVEWEGGSPERFDHRRAGYALEGAHAKVMCASCHQPKFQRSLVTVRIRVADRSHSWLGLDTACGSCHVDPHRNELGHDCRSCHGMTAWKPAPGFDHERSHYPLTGAHTSVECAKCHATPAVVTAHDAAGKPIPRWKPLPHAECASCHRDPHAGRFRGACADCHQTRAWAAIRREGFNHDQTRYPLRGAHATLACASCHDERRAFGAKPKFALCTDCHRDAHAGAATRAGQVVDCASCHQVQSFEHSTFTVADHATSRYPLEGAHAAAACASCHARIPAGPAAATLGTARVVLRPSFDACTSCHRDPHEGRFTAANSKSKRIECRNCHTLDRFHPSSYDAHAHEACVFPLEGAHRAVACASCHRELRDLPASSSLRAAAHGQHTITFMTDARRCVECHADPHGNQFAADKGGIACERCHGADTFRPADRFDHRRQAAFKLDGAHATVACAACHPAQRGRDGVTRVLYRPIPSRCVDCHTDGLPTAPSHTGFLPPRRRAGAALALAAPMRMEGAHVASH